MIEGLQPSWLSPRGWQRIYFVASRLSGSLIIWLIIGLLSMRQSETLVNNLINLITTLVTGLAVGLNIGFIDALRFEWFHKWIGMRKSMTLLLSVANIAVISLSVGCILGLVVRQFDVVTWIVGFVFGLIFGLRGSQRSLENDIHTVEALRWSWRKALKGGPFGVIVGLLFGLILSTYYGPNIRVTIFIGLLGGLFGAVFNGITRNIVETKSTPNQGIRLSIRNSVVGGLIFGSIASLIVWWLGNVMITVVVIGLFLGLPGVLWYGGLDVFQHYVLRLILLTQRHTPANYARFLDYAVDRIFLQKVGGGYRFIHRLLLEHFAEMGETPKV